MANEPTSQQANEPMSQRANKPTSQQANKPTSRQANCLAPRLLWLCRHCTPFVLCWGEGISFSSQHASRRVLCLAKVDGYIPGWGRKMVVVDVVVAAGSTQQAQLATQRNTAHSPACYTAPYTACYITRRRVLKKAIVHCAHYQLYGALLVCLAVNCLKK